MDRTMAAETLRSWALDEDAKAHVMEDPVLAPIARRIAARYVAGEDVGAALAAVLRAAARGHLGSVEFAGESVRDRDEAIAATDVFLSAAQAIADSGLAATVSGDLSHVGLLVSDDLVRSNALEIVRACEAAGTTFMISAEGSQRTDAVLDVYEWLSARSANVGITLQARLHRSATDLERLKLMPGRVRLVKGAFLETEAVAVPRGSEELQRRYRDLAGAALEAGVPLTLATHDEQLLRSTVASIMDRTNVEIEMLMGLGDELLDLMRADGWTTREYCIFGDEWWLYVLNRIAEQPERIFHAIVDVGGRH